MEGARLKENDFQEDIEKIEFYSEEEKNTTTKIMASIQAISNLYKSNQRNQLARINLNLELNFQTINKNRQAYSIALKNVIVRYTETLEVVEKIMEDSSWEKN